MSTLHSAILVPGERQSRTDGLLFRLVTALTAFFVAVPALAYLAYLGLSPVIVLILTVISVPLAILAAQQYFSWILLLYRSKYRMFKVAGAGREISAELNMRLLLFDLVPVGDLMKELIRMEQAKLLRQTTAWWLMLRDIGMALTGGIFSYFVMRSLHLGLRIVPVYGAFLGFLACSRLISPSRQAYAWARIVRLFRTETLKKGLFDSLYKGFLPRLPPPSRSDSH